VRAERPLLCSSGSLRVGAVRPDRPAGEFGWGGTHARQQRGRPMRRLPVAERSVEWQGKSGVEARPAGPCGVKAGPRDPSRVAARAGVTEKLPQG
jgi:hypothetical protein